VPVDPAVPEVFSAPQRDYPGRHENGARPHIRRADRGTPDSPLGPDNLIYVYERMEDPQ